MKTKITELLAAATFEEGGEWLNIIIDPKDWLPFARQLRHEETLHFDYLFCVTCIDFKINLTMVYHLSSTKFRHNIVVRSVLNRKHPEIETVSGIHYGRRPNFMKEKCMKCLE